MLRIQVSVSRAPIAIKAGITMSKSAPGQRPSHDHKRCVERAVAAAERVCAAKQFNLTPIRKRVLEIVWRQHQPIGAYEILAELARDGGKPAPQTVYRALEFLQDAGLVHRLDTLNAFLGCDRPEDAHSGQFLVCSRCRRVAEIEDSVVNRTLKDRARSLGFRLDASAVEIKAICAQCAIPG
jgi:Fur family transcriptional regulator, zinc uptake regulator